MVISNLLESYEKSNQDVLTEATRQELITQSKKGRPTKTYGTSRFVRRTKSRINPSSKNYNQIDMNALFKGGLLSFKVPVHGETNEYEVELLFDNFLEELQKQTKQEKKPCEYKTVAQALMRAYNRDDTYISCSCPDFKYRFAYHATKGRYNAGKPELRPSDITNPRNDLGAGCKHTMLVLSNLRWAMKVATVINNYIKYMEKNMPKLYADVIFPAVYGMSYNKATQLGLFDDEEAELINTMDNKKDTSTLDTANAEASTKFRKGGVGKVNNQQPAFKKKPAVDKDQMSLDLDVETESLHEELSIDKYTGYYDPYSVDYLYHWVKDAKTRDWVLENGLVPDSDGDVYLSFKPLNVPGHSGGYIFRVTIPDKEHLYDWRELWYDDNGEEFDAGHVYDTSNPYFIYMGRIPPQYLTLIGEEEK